MAKYNSDRSKKKAMKIVKKFSKGNYGVEGSLRPIKTTKQLRDIIIKEDIEQEYLNDKDIL